MRKQLIAGLSASALILFTMTLFVVPAASAASGPTGFTVSPWVYDPGSACPGIVSAWDSTIGNPAPSLHLNKPCLTTTNAASGATVNGVQGITLTELNFDYQGYCGAGAPRYNVVTNDDVTHFLGCASATKTVLANGWTHAVWDPSNPTQAFPIILPGETVKAIDIVFDEQSASVVYLDNFSVNGAVVGAPTAGQSKELCKKGGWKTMTDAHGNRFKNQGQCIKYFERLSKKNKDHGHDGDRNERDHDNHDDND